jgi:hypothetical protein
VEGGMRVEGISRGRRARERTWNLGGRERGT